MWNLHMCIWIDIYEYIYVCIEAERGEWGRGGEEGRDGKRGERENVGRGKQGGAN